MIKNCKELLPVVASTLMGVALRHSSSPCVHLVSNLLLTSSFIFSSHKFYSSIFKEKEVKTIEVLPYAFAGGLSLAASSYSTFFLGLSLTASYHCFRSTKLYPYLKTYLEFFATLPNPAMLKTVMLIMQGRETYATDALGAATYFQAARLELAPELPELKERWPLLKMLIEASDTALARARLQMKSLNTKNQKEGKKLKKQSNTPDSNVSVGLTLTVKRTTPLPLRPTLLLMNGTTTTHNI